MKDELTASKWGARILNALFRKSGLDSPRLHVEVTDRQVSLTKRGKSIYDGLLFGNPKKDARVFSNLLDAVIYAASKEVGDWYAPVFAEQIRDKLAEVC
jgi:hypothetical protein